MKYGNRSISIWKKIISSPVFLILILVIFAILTKATWNIHQKSLFSSSKLNQAQAELVKLEMRRIDLENKIGHISTEQGIEGELRTKYRATKDGESVAVIVEDVSQADASDSRFLGAENSGQEIPAAKEQGSWWRRVLKYIAGMV